MKEVITLQFGEQANYVGAYYWSLMQAGIDAADHDRKQSLAIQTLYTERPGTLQNSQNSNPDYVPRVLIYDKPENFSGSQQDPANAIGETEEPEYEISGQKTEIHRQLARQKPDNSAITTWTDVIQARYHPNTNNRVSGVQFGNSLGQMTQYFEGQNVFKGEDSREDILEGRLRQFAEQCDWLQGFQVLSDAVGGFAGYSMAYLERLQEEYPKTTVCLYNVEARSWWDSIGGSEKMDMAVGLAAALDLEVSMVVKLFASENKDAVRSSESLCGSAARLAAHVAQWSQGLLMGACAMDDIVQQTTQQKYYRVVESLLARGIQIEDTTGGRGKRMLDVHEILDKQFASDIVDSSMPPGNGWIGEIAGGVLADRGTSTGRLVSQHQRSDRLFCLDLGGPARMPKAYPNVLNASPDNNTLQASRLERSNGSEDVCLAGLLCSTGASRVHMRGMLASMQIESSKHLKEYERDTIRDLRHTLETTVDRYQELATDAESEE